MFTGIISDIGQIIDLTPSGDLRRLRIASAFDAGRFRLAHRSPIPAPASR